MDFKASAPGQPDYHLDLHHLDFIKDSVCQKTNKQKNRVKARLSDQSISYHKILYTTMAGISMICLGES